MNRPQLTRGQAFFMSAFTLFIALFAGYFAFKQLRDENALKKDGVTVQGTVRNIQETQGRYTNYLLTYDFRAGGAPRRATESISSIASNSLSAGQEIEVTYLSSNPAVCKTSVSTPHDANLMLIIGGLVLFVSIALFFAGLTGKR